MPYQLFVPLARKMNSIRSNKHDGDNRGRRPAIVFLHGTGDVMNALRPFDVMNAQSLPRLLLRNDSFARDFPFVALFPCSTCLHAKTSGPASPHGWIEANFQRINALISMIIAHHRVDPQRIALTGQNMGGGGLWRYASAHPRLFSALVPVCEAMRPKEQIVRSVCCAEGPAAGCCPPVWAFHAANDSSVMWSDQTVSMLRETNERHGQFIRYTRYERAPQPPMREFRSMVGSGSCELAYRQRELWEWLLDQRCVGRPHLDYILCTPAPVRGYDLSASLCLCPLLSPLAGAQDLLPALPRATAWIQASSAWARAKTKGRGVCRLHGRAQRSTSPQVGPATRLAWICILHQRLFTHGPRGLNPRRDGVGGQHGRHPLTSSLATLAPPALAAAAARALAHALDRLGYSSVYRSRVRATSVNQQRTRPRHRFQRQGLSQPLCLYGHE